MNKLSKILLVVVIILIITIIGLYMKIREVYGGTLILAENIYELNVKVQELEDKIVE